MHYIFREGAFHTVTALTVLSTVTVFLTVTTHKGNNGEFSFGSRPSVTVLTAISMDFFALTFSTLKTNFSSLLKENKPPSSKIAKGVFDVRTVGKVKAKMSNSFPYGNNQIHVPNGSLIAWKILKDFCVICELPVGHYQFKLFI